jgi:hypothetical protein
MDEVFIANDERVDISAIGTQMMLSRKKPIKKFVEQTFTTDVQWNYPSRVGPYALHIDINKFIDYIADFCVEKYGIKVVEMWRVGEDEFGEVGKHFHRMNWMSKEAQANLLDELERDYMDNHSVMAHPDFIEAMNNPTESEWLESKAELHYGI